MKLNKFEVMTPAHPRWDEFCIKLEKKCKFKKTVQGEFTWKCGGGENKTYSKSILAKMGLTKSDIEMSMYFFEANGGMCDCEILFNVDR